MSLQGKVCVVTAAGQGIGRASAELFFKEGAKVFARLFRVEKLKPSHNWVFSFAWLHNRTL